ncbi:hypothetical protein [Robertmurraya siralis]|uniref:hypothetical protein n=1 Tax=Robertmurraya siralis TaxID=77777 RepID=UPI0010F85C1D|nr:hypothetical protein [Robertmurraya siralis]
MKYSIWITAKGEELTMSQMTTKHIENCINMIERSRFENNRDLYEELPEPPLKTTVDYELYKPYLKIFKEELTRRENL